MGVWRPDEYFKLPWLDPICGKGYALLSVVTGHRAAIQLAAALACIKLTSGPLECPHYTYDKYGQDPTQGKIYQGAKFVVAQLGVPTR